eukprot:3108294-Prymnesium_polylepis.1
MFSVGFRSFARTHRDGRVACVESFSPLCAFSQAPCGLALVPALQQRVAGQLAATPCPQVSHVNRSPDSARNSVSC